jgi:signal transduction histidine kinase/ligand-binding sensor domain-containing protein
MLTVLRICIMLLLAVLPGTARLCAQSFDYGFKHLTTDQGLSHDNVHYITKDERGFMWFGTMNGLNRFDGLQFKVYKHKQDDTTSIPGNFITSIAAEGGYLWVATTAGVCRYNPSTDKFTRLTFPDTPGIDVSQLIRTSTGKIFIARNHNIYELDIATLKPRKVQKFMDTYQDFLLFAGPDGNVWVRVSAALYLFNASTYELKYIQGVDHKHTERPSIMTAYTDPNGQTWVGSWEGGLLKYNESTGKCEQVSQSIPFLVSIGADVKYEENNLLWASGGYSGLNLYDVKTGRVIDLPKNIQQPWSHNGGRIHVYYRDTANGILWIGTEYGIEKYDQTTEYFARKVLPSTGEIGQFPSVNAVIRDKTDPSGRTWWIAAWVGGFHKWDRYHNTLTSYSHKLHTPEIFDAEQDDEGNIWIAEWRGVQVFNPRTNQWKLIDSFIRKDTVSSKVLSLMKDRAGNMWFAQNYDGFFRHDAKLKQIKRIPLSSVLDKSERVYVLGMAEDRSGNVWAASAYHSFCITPDGVVSELKIKPNPYGIKHSGGAGIVADRQDNLWITHGDKLVNLTREGEVIKVYTQENGLLATILRGILMDGQGYLWIATENSLHRLNPVTGHFRYYKKEDGLFNNNLIEPMSIADNGELFVGFHNAFSYTNINKLNHTVRNVPFIITSIQAEDRMIDPLHTTDITLQPHENSLSLEFAALDYSKPEKIKYAYWLEGLEKDWHFTPQRSVSFANLPGGNYKLHLKVMGPDGVLSKEEIALGITVIPHFYATWWFWTIVAIGVASLLYAYYDIRKGQKKRLEKIRERIATDLHDDMGSTLSSIRIFSDVMRKQLDGTQPQLTPMLEKISNNASQLSDNMQDIIWTIKQDHDKLEDLVTRIREFGLKLCDAKDIAFKVHISDSFRTSKLDLEQRRNLYLIFKECLNNAIKYAACSTIQLFITQQGRHLKMVIEDNGKGFDEMSITRGNGLSNVRKRAREINGEATIDSAPGKGTRIDILVNLA